MSDNPINKSRRDAIKAMMGGLAAVPLMNLVGLTAVQAEELPPVCEAMEPTCGKADPVAFQLKYREDATVKHEGLPEAPPDQLCSNCLQIQAEEGDRRPCALFPGKTVTAKGWCTSWMAKQATPKPAA